MYPFEKSMRNHKFSNTYLNSDAIRRHRRLMLLDMHQVVSEPFFSAAPSDLRDHVASPEGRGRWRGSSQVSIHHRAFYEAREQQCRSTAADLEISHHHQAPDKAMGHQVRSAAGDPSPDLDPKNYQHVQHQGKLEKMEQQHLKVMDQLKILSSRLTASPRKCQISPSQSPSDRKLNHRGSDCETRSDRAAEEEEGSDDDHIFNRSLLNKKKKRK